MLFIITTALLISHLISACLLLHYYRHADAASRSYLRYAMSYFGCLVLTYVAYLIRFSFSLPLSVFFTHFFSLMATCSLLFAFQTRLENCARPWHSLWLLYPLVVASVALVLVQYYPDKYLLRSLSLYIHNAIVYLTIMYVLTGYFRRGYDPSGKALCMGVAALILLSFIIPLVFVTTHEVHTQHVTLTSIQVIVSQISLAMVLIMLFTKDASSRRRSSH